MIKSKFDIRHVTPEIVDEVINDFWKQATMVGPEALGAVDAVEFRTLMEASQEWPIVLSGLQQVRRPQGPLTMSDVVDGQIYMALRIGILIGLETAARK